MVTLKEEQKRLHIQKKTKQKELTVLQKSSDFLKMTENKVTECNQIEAGEKEIELEKMKANYDDLKGTIKLPGMIKENDSLRRNIENLNINIAECQKEINECDRSINEGRNNRSYVDILDYEASLGKHTTLNKELAELRKSKRTASKQIENPGESVRDTATEILQNIYELSAGLGISVESEVNDSYSVICNRISAGKPSVAKARSPIVSRQQPQKYSVTSSSTSRPQALKRNNFVVNNKPGTADSRHRSSIKSRVPTEPDNRVNKANEGVVEPKTEIVSELAKIVKEDKAVIKIDNGKKSFKEDNEQTDQPKTQPKVSDDIVLYHQNIKKDAKIERNDNNEFGVDGKLESKDVLTKKSEAILQSSENRDHNQPVKQADMKIADTPDQSKAAKAKPDNNDVKTKPVNVLPTSLPDVANIGISSFIIVNRLLIDLALADIDSFSAKKQFINLNFFEVEDRAAEFGKAHRKYSKPSDLAELMHQLLEYKDAYNLETVKQQSAIVEYMSFESLAGNYQSAVNATIEQVCEFNSVT
jgi:hypothetical protein